jgi:hypothetical protein
MQIALVPLWYINPEDGNLFAETYVGFETISYTCAVTKSRHSTEIHRTIPYTLDLPLLGLFLPFISSPTFHFWEATRVYLISGVFFLRTQQPGFEG